MEIKIRKRRVKTGKRVQSRAFNKKASEANTPHERMSQLSRLSTFRCSEPRLFMQRHSKNITGKQSHIGLPPSSNYSICQSRNNVDPSQSLWKMHRRTYDLIEKNAQKSSPLKTPSQFRGMTEFKIYSQQTADGPRVIPTETEHHQNSMYTSQEHHDRPSTMPKQLQQNLKLQFNRNSAYSSVIYDQSSRIT